MYSLKTYAINCGSPVHKNKAICRSKSNVEPIINPKELIEKVTVLIEGNGNPGSGVIINKENNLYSILTSAHVVCSRRNQSVDTEEYAVKTFDGVWHDSYDNSNLNVKCPPILTGQEKMSSKFCSAAVSKAYPWPIDIAILEFKSNKEYEVAKKSSSIKKLGKDVYISGYPISKDGKLVIRESQGTVDVPPSSINQTCKGYGLRYIAQTEVGMDGGGVWSKNGRLVGIHGYREVSREDDIALNRGSYGSGIHVPYWKEMIDPLNPSKGFTEDFEKKDGKDDVYGIISKAKAFINVARSEKINNNPNFIIEEASTSILEDLKRAEKIDSKQPLVPALLAQIYIRRYEDGSKQKVYLTNALKNINKAILLQKPNWLGPKASYDGSFEAIRAYVHFLYGQHINNQDSILSYRYAIKNIDARLSLKPNDVESWKDKANYHFYAKELGNAYASLIKASKLAPKDPSIFIDMGFILVENKEYIKACEDFKRAKNLINEGITRQGSQGSFAKDYKQQKKRMKPFTDALGC
ncbi:trypsin-like peptidase domain-containing protein [Prochlorococcus marinus]|uniref:trypsin-like peptidase domain-containing protein n=1 Tax=Prochlorococcus TaxID=1218 RepID=UPI00187CD0D5|nr:trypsin-like peptidase domain-containing protein [Prochlorococcus marinus]